MLGRLVISFVIILVSFLVCLFDLGFVRGEVYDVTKIKLKKKTRMLKYQKKIYKGLEFINKLSYEKIQINSFDNITLVAKYYENIKSNKCVILCHGYRSVPQNDFAGSFEIYYKLGYNILLIDQRSHGDSEGKIITFGIKESKDIKSWCEYIDSRNMKKIVLVGISMGATSVLLASGLDLPISVKRSYSRLFFYFTKRNSV